MLTFLLACTASDEPAPLPTGGDEACDSDWAVVRFATDDGETLEADWKPGPEEGGTAVVLFHMIPPSNDRSGYPLRVRDELANLDVAVLNVDRRGAGGSTGEAEEAYGVGAVEDAEAAIRFLLDADTTCSPNPDNIVLVGASNGTTTVFDYTAERDASLPLPAANIFLSAGSYTFAQNPLSPSQDDWSLDLSFPFLWLYPSNEPFSEQYVPDKPGAWKFVELGTAHGTQMFDAGDLEQQAVGEMADWVTAVRDGEEDSKPAAIEDGIVSPRAEEPPNRNR